MESQWIAEYSHANVMDKRPRKRARVNWDVAPPVSPPKDKEKKIFNHFGWLNGWGAQVLYCAQEVVNRSGTNQLFASSYYNGGVPRNASPPWRDDDKDGHYIFAVGENLTSRYRILSKMGEGTFGQVLECWDQEKKEVVAIKIVRSIHKYREAAMIEIDMLQKLVKHDIGGTRHA